MSEVRMYMDEANLHFVSLATGSCEIDEIEEKKNLKTKQNMNCELVRSTVFY